MSSDLRDNFKKNIQYCVEQKIKKIIMFIKDEESILSVKTYLQEQEIHLDLIGVTFPANEPIYKLNDQKEIEEFIPKAAKGEEVREILRNKGIPLISSALPFEGIVIPGDNYNPYKIIEQTFSIVNKALPNLVQTLLIATDSGQVLPRERVVVMNAILAIDVLGTNTRFLFHPDEGMEINTIIQG